MSKTSRARILALALLLAALAAPLAAKELLAPHHVAQLRQVTAAVISPDGAQVAYILEVPRRPFQHKDGPVWTELHLVEANGVSRPFVTGEVNVSRIDWTADGKGISFLAQRAGDDHRTLYVIPADGGEARRVLAFETDIAAYSWSPDGKRVAFLAAAPEPAAKKKLKEKGFSQQIYEEEVPFVRVWIAALGEKSDKPRMLDLPGSASELHWSPVDNRLVVALAPTPLVDDDLMSRKVHVVDAETGKVLARLDNPGKLGQVAWRPDGKQLAMISAADINDPREGRLLIAPAAGGALHDLLPGYEGHVSAIAWQDADTVMFVGDEGVWTTFNRIYADGSDRKTIVAAGGPVFTDFTLSRHGLSGAFRGHSPSHQAEVFLMRHGEVGPRRLTDSNPWLADIQLAAQEVVRYKARDGLELEGILIRPLNEEKGKHYPLILVVHGGPEAHYRNGWLTGHSLPGHLGAARGFAIFYPNYRGSTGRGVEFSKLNLGDVAGKEFDDLVDAADHLVTIGLVARDHVGITGISYGGYAAAWGATYYSERFAAAVVYVGVSDMVSNFGTTDLPQAWSLNYKRWPWERWRFFLERSPIYHAGKSKTPTLILAGKEDHGQASQSMELYRYLKLQSQAPVRLVFYPGEPHGNRRAASRLDYNLRMLRWMEHYLKGPGGAPPASELDYETALKED